MSQGAILILIAVSSFCIWMATHPSPPRTRRSDPRSRRDPDQEVEDSDDAYPTRLRRAEERESNVARVRLQAAGRNRWDRRDLHDGVGRDSDIDEPDMLIWPQRRQILVSKLR
jgi:hypothetical protein